MEEWQVPWNDDDPSEKTPYLRGLRNKIRWWWQDRRRDAAQKRVEKKLRKAINNLLQIERYALRREAIFGPVHDELVDAISRLDAALSDYDGRINQWPVGKIGYEAAARRAGLD